MSKLAESLIFSFFVALSMVMLDALYHLATETAVHINYAAVKFTIIYFVVFLVCYWVGKSNTEGIFTSVSGPVIFYVYYIFANPTLNRELFKIDENFGYIFVHITALLIAYFVFYKVWVLRKGNKLVKSLGYAFIISLCIYGLDAGYQLSYVQFTTHNEEMTAKVLNFASSIYLVLLLFAVSFLSYFFVKNHKIQQTTLFAGSVLLIYLFGQNIGRSIFSIVTLLLILYLANIYNKIADKSNKTEKHRK